MNAQRVIAQLEFAEVDSRLDADTRRMMRQERFAVRDAILSGDAGKIAAATAEALRVAEMWGVCLAS